MSHFKKKTETVCAQDFTIGFINNTSKSLLNQCSACKVGDRETEVSAFLS